MKSNREKRLKEAYDNFNEEIDEELAAELTPKVGLVGVEENETADEVLERQNTLVASNLAAAAIHFTQRYKDSSMTSGTLKDLYVVLALEFFDTVYDTLDVDDSVNKQNKLH